MLTDMKITAFLEELASDSPAPGGGSVAALVGALGAGLASMYSRLTLGKKGYEDVHGIFKETLPNFESIREELTELIDQDTKAFNQLIQAFKMPNKTKEQQKQRHKAIQKEYKKVTHVPLKTARNALKLSKLLSKIGCKGNKNALSDVAVAALCSLTSLESAVFNVRINLPAIKDETFVSRTKKEVDFLLEKGKEQASELVKGVKERICEG